MTCRTLTKETSNDLKFVSIEVKKKFFEKMNNTSFHDNNVFLNVLP